jgi:pimeloyl-ACP methyl ester carboxylesterase
LPELFVVDEGAGPAVLLVHGLWASSRDWIPVASALTADHRVLIPDRPGYGRSGGGPLSMADTADRLADTLRTRSSGSAIVVGHSYGGGVAVLLAARHPTLVSGLVLAATVGRTDSRYPWGRQVLAWPPIGEATCAAKLLVFGWLAPRVRRVAGSSAGPPLRSSSTAPDTEPVEVSATWQPGLWRTAAADQRSLLREMGSIETSLSRLTLPTVVVTGALDAVVSPSVAVHTAAQLEAAELVILPGTGHSVPHDAPDALVSAVRSVERRVDGHGRP